jgi:hypothetical protein
MALEKHELEAINKMIPFERLVEKGKQKELLIELKDICKHYFSAIMEEATYEGATIEKLAKTAKFGWEIIDHYDTYGR